MLLRLLLTALLTLSGIAPAVAQEAEPTTSLTVRFVDDLGAPIVSLPVPLRQVLPRWDSGSAHTNYLGEVLFDDLEPGGYYLELGHLHEDYLRPDIWTTGQHLRCRKYFSLSADELKTMRFVLPRRSVTRHRLAYDDETPLRPPAAVSLTTTDPYVTLRANVDADGYFTLPALPHDRAVTLRVKRQSLHFHRVTAVPPEVLIKRRARVVVALDTPPGILPKHLTLRRETPDGKRYSYTGVQRDGDFFFEDVPPGECVLSCRTFTSRLVSTGVPAQLVDRQTTRLRFSLSPAKDKAPPAKGTHANHLVRIVDQSGAPIAGVEVGMGELKGYAGASRRPWVYAEPPSVTDEDGVVRLPFGFGLVRASKSGYCTVQAGRSSFSAPLKLQRSATIQLLLNDAHGLPVPDRRVYTAESGVFGTMPWGVTDAKGFCELDIPAGVRRLHIAMERERGSDRYGWDNYLHYPAATLEVTTTPDEVVRLRHTLQTPVRATGSVLLNNETVRYGAIFFNDESGAVVAAAGVTPMGTYRAWLPTTGTYTATVYVDPALTCLPGGGPQPYSPQTNSLASTTPMIMPYPVSGDGKPLDVQLQTFRCSGVICDANGVPDAARSVVLRRQGQRPPVMQYTPGYHGTTDAFGAFTFHEVAQGTYWLTVNASEHGPLVDRRSVVIDSHRELTLEEVPSRPLKLSIHGESAPPGNIFLSAEFGGVPQRTPPKVTVGGVPIFVPTPTCGWTRVPARGGVVRLNDADRGSLPAGDKMPSQLSLEH